MEEADVVRIVESSIAKKNESLLASMKSMLESSLTDLKRSHADTADSHLNEIKKLKFDEPHRFKKKGNEDQYRFNLTVGDAIEEAKEACSSQQLDKVHASLENCVKYLISWNLRSHDTSRHSENRRMKRNVSWNMTCTGVFCSLHVLWWRVSKNHGVDTQVWRVMGY